MTPQATRVRLLLGSAEGKGRTDMAEVLRIHPVLVSMIVRRFNERGMDGLSKQPNHELGRAPTEVKIVIWILRLAQKERPEGATHPSTREPAKRVGISHTKMRQILRERELKPHLVKRFRSRKDSDIEQRLEDILGLYMNPSENAIVLRVDEEWQVQALERAQTDSSPAAWNPRATDA